MRELIFAAVAASMLGGGSGQFGHGGSSPVDAFRGSVISMLRGTDDGIFTIRSTPVDAAVNLSPARFGW